MKKKQHNYPDLKLPKQVYRDRANAAATHVYEKQVAEAAHSRSGRLDRFIDRARERGLGNFRRVEKLLYMLLPHGSNWRVERIAPDLNAPHSEDAALAFSICAGMGEAQALLAVMLGAPIGKSEYQRLIIELAPYAMSVGAIDINAQKSVLVALKELGRDEPYSERQRRNLVGVSRQEWRESWAESYLRLLNLFEEVAILEIIGVDAASKDAATATSGTINGIGDLPDADAAESREDAPAHAIFESYWLAYADLIKDAIGEEKYAELRAQMLSKQFRRQPGLKATERKRVIAERMVTAGTVYAGAHLVGDAKQQFEVDEDTDHELPLTPENVALLAAELEKDPEAGKKNPRNRTFAIDKKGQKHPDKVRKGFSVEDTAKWVGKHEGKGTGHGKNQLKNLRDDALLWLRENQLTDVARRRIVRHYGNMPIAEEPQDDSK